MPVCWILTWNIDLELQSFVAVNAVKGPDFDPGNSLGNDHSRQRSGERLLVHMRMMKHPRPQVLAVEGFHLPPVGIVLPPLIGVLQGDIKPVFLTGIGQ